MKYLAYLVQEGDGCDYTIGFGIRIWKFNALDFKDAVKTVKQKVKKEFNHDEYKLDHITIFETPHYSEIDVKAIYEEFMSEEEKELKEKELAELARLKLKYE